VSAPAGATHPQHAETGPDFEPAGVGAAAW